MDDDESLAHIDDDDLLREIGARYEHFAFVGLRPSIMHDDLKDRTIATSGHPLKIVGLIEYLKYRCICDYDDSDQNQ